MCLLPTHNGQPLPALSDNKKRCRIQPSFCQADKHNSQAPILANQLCKCTCIADHIGLVGWGSSPPTPPPSIHPTPPSPPPTHPKKNRITRCIGYVAVLNTESCAHRTFTAPIPIHLFPFFSPWAGQLLSTLPMGEKKWEMGDGTGAVCLLPTQWSAIASSE